MSRGDASVLRCYAGNVTSGNAAYQRHTPLVTEEQSAPHRNAEAYLPDRPTPTVIRPIDTPQRGVRISPTLRATSIGSPSN
jgi:hypothetical protein